MPLSQFAASAAAMALAATGPAVTGTDTDERFVFRGAGFGHGVGMSQFGAKGFAERGRSHSEILGHYYSNTVLGNLDGEGGTRVLLLSRPEVRFDGASSIGDRALQPEKTYTARLRGGFVELLSPAGRPLARFKGAPAVRGPGSFRLYGSTSGGITDGAYRGELELRPAGDQIQAINVVGLEDYVRGVVAAEMPSGWHPEALKAQAVAARTYAITTSKSGTFDHYADIRSQVYQGIAGEVASTDAAVVATAGQVVTYDGRPATTYFFSTSGGRTEDNESSFLGGAPSPWLRSVRDPFDDGGDRHRWGPTSWSMQRAQDELGDWVRGTLRTIEVTDRGSSPRVVSAFVTGTGGRTEVTGPQIRKRLGLDDTWAYFTTIRTTATSLERTDDPDDPRGRLSGIVRPGGADNGIAVQRRVDGRWREVTEAKTTGGGRYLVELERPGRYRVVERGMPGPTVKVR
jgi:stage II sporulation protein D